MEPSLQNPAVSCPVCLAQSTHHQSDVQDHFLSGEMFRLQRCDACKVIFTWPQPAPAEIAKYYQSEEYISHSTQSNGIMDRVYRIVRRFTLAAKYRHIQTRKAKGTLLDIGCGTGHFLHFMHQKGWKVQGIEPGDQARQAAVDQFGLEVGQEAALEQLPDHLFDVITMWHVLEHVHDPTARMRQVHRLLKEDGLAIIALPNPGADDALRYGSHWAAWDVPRHLFHFTRTAFGNLASQTGFRLIQTLPMPFDAYYVSLLSEQYLNGSKRIIPAIFHGLKSNLKARKTGNYSSLIYLLKK